MELKEFTQEVLARLKQEQIEFEWDGKDIIHFPNCLVLLVLYQEFKYYRYIPNSFSIKLYENTDERPVTYKQTLTKPLNWPLVLKRLRSYLQDGILRTAEKKQREAEEQAVREANKPALDKLIKLSGDSMIVSTFAGTTGKFTVRKNVSISGTQEKVIKAIELIKQLEDLE